MIVADICILHDNAEMMTFQALNGLHSTNILCNVDDDLSKTYDDLNDK